jgi:hypothetical protein
LDFGIGLRSYEWDGPEGLLSLMISGDWILRTKASTAEQMEDLSQVLRTELKRPVRFVFRPTEQPVVVVTGRYQFHSLPPSLNYIPGLVHAYAGTFNPTFALLTSHRPYRGRECGFSAEVCTTKLLSSGPAATLR